MKFQVSGALFQIINMHFLKTGMTKSSSSEADCKQKESRKKEEIIKETKNQTDRVSYNR